MYQCILWVYRFTVWCYLFVLSLCLIDTRVLYCKQSERYFNSQLYDLRHRLEQSHSTNRSLQSYVEFLKNSYTAVFSDTIAGLPTTTANGTADSVLARTYH